MISSSLCPGEPSDPVPGPRCVFSAVHSSDLYAASETRTTVREKSKSLRTVSSRVCVFCGDCAGGASESDGTGSYAVDIAHRWE